MAQVPERQSAAPLLAVEGLRVEFASGRRMVRVLDGIDFTLQRGETLCLVGESGCGKSMTALAIMGLVPNPPGRISAGRICLDGEDLVQAGPARLRQIRGKSISMVFQEPMTSLNPVFSIGDQVAEVVELHERTGRRAARARAAEMLQAVGIPEAKRRLHDFPHQLSGGMRQRVMIAMALACRPAVLIADEPTTALDVTVQAQIFDLLKQLQAETGTAIVMITHDMGAVAEMADKVIVLYAGRKVEDGPVAEVLAAPRHPYTRGLIDCVPHLRADMPVERRLLAEIPGVVPSLAALPEGCPFAPRCGEAMEKCRHAMPPGFVFGPQHAAACWLWEGTGA